MEKITTNKLDPIKNLKLMHADTKAEIEFKNLWESLSKDQFVFIIFLRHFG